MYFHRTRWELLNSNIVDKIICISLHCRHFDQSHMTKLWVLIIIIIIIIILLLLKTLYVPQRVFSIQLQYAI
jgi:uncharacterized membrane-anchored protein